MESLYQLAYLVGAICFILGLRGLSDPKTANRGNRLAAIGMLIAIVVSLIYPLETGDNNFMWLIGSMIIGGLIGWRQAAKVEMTAMPQLVSLFNGFGGASAMLLAISEYLKMDYSQAATKTIVLSTLLVGAISFSGSILAYLKLDGKVRDKHVTVKGHQFLNIFLLIVTLASIVYAFVQPSALSLIIATVLSLIYGFSFVAPIGGADMPVVISLLNSVTGISAAIAGLFYNNQIMILGGILVGASGIILTVMMCEAMNRSLMNVLIGNFSNSGGGGNAVDENAGKAVNKVTPMDVAILLKYAEKVVVVPGYGMAVAQAQKQAKELDELLGKDDIEVFYGIHPVAGRMPGHMNVLLAEVDISYDKLLDLESCNSELKDTDVVLVVGANDVVNPSALDNPDSSIYGMPVLQVWDAKQVVVFKRSMKPGYAGIQNPLFFKDNTKMLFGDAKDSLGKIITDLKSL